MKLEDFKLADCALLRRPPVAVDEVNRRIETVLVEAWTGGASAEEAVESLLSNRELFEALARKMESSLEYQRKLRMQAVERRLKEKLEAQDARRERAREALRERRRAEEAKLAAAREALLAKQSEMTAARERVAKLRVRVEKQREELGPLGEGLKALESIAGPIAPAPEPASKPAGAADQSPPPLRDRVVKRPARGAPAPPAEETQTTAAPASGQREAAAPVPGYLAYEVTGQQEQEQQQTDALRPRWLFSGRVYRWFQQTPRRRRVFKVISFELW
jgi:hypothetical protein